MSRTMYLENGNIFLGTASSTYSRSLTISDGVVVGIGAAAPERCERVDLQGHFAMPGFVDSHLHLVQGASVMGNVDLKKVSSREAFCATLAAAVSDVHSNTWVVGFGWTQERLLGTPTKEWFSENVAVPMLCYRVDFHSAVLNDAALEQLPLSKIENMPGGSAIRSGIVQEDALYDGVGPLMPKVDVEVKRTRTLQALKEMQREGITLIGSMEELHDVEDVLAELDLSQQMRIRTMLLDAPSIDVLSRSKQFQGDFLNVFGFKAFLDGSLGSRTAKMYQPWNDCEGSGVWAGLAANETLQSWVHEVVAAGFAPVMHAIGDEAVGLALQVLKGVDENARIEHAQCIAEKEVPYLLKKMFGVQPLHQPSDATIAAQALGRERAAQLHNWTRMLDAGAYLSFGSDWPVAAANPIAAIQVAITQGLSVTEAIAASTRVAADSLGTPLSGELQLGSYGDVVILDSNPFECDWINTQPSVTMTILAGNIVYIKEE
jgi:predicted amidohydrolase YtcJ